MWAGCAQGGPDVGAGPVRCTWRRALHATADNFPRASRAMNGSRDLLRAKLLEAHVVKGRRNTRVPSPRPCILRKLPWRRASVSPTKGRKESQTGAQRRLGGG